MSISSQIIVNADDIGLKPSVNKAILYCFEQGYINSTSLLTNMPSFNDAVDIIYNNPVITNIGVHVNLAEGKPVTNFSKYGFTNEAGDWDITKTGKLFNTLNKETRTAFYKEINAQIEKALTAKIKITHLDAHLHLHTLPAFYSLFIEAAKTYNLKLRLAQTYKEDSYFKFYYRKYINNKIKKNNGNYTDFFETVDEFLKNKNRVLDAKTVEIMVHPDFDASGKLVDHVNQTSMQNWINYLRGHAI